MKNYIIVLPALLVLMGCSSVKDHYSAYSGSQEWPTRENVSPQAARGVDIYYDYPDHHYVVIGRDWVSVPNDYAWEKVTGDLADIAREHGADAVIIEGTSKPRADIPQTRVNDTLITHFSSGYPSADYVTRRGDGDNDNGGNAMITHALFIKFKPREEANTAAK
jgi:hypothetical protein